MQELYHEVVDITAPWVKRPETIVLHHGVGSTSDLWADWLPVLAEDYRIVRFDMRGFGRSTDLAPDKWTMSQLVSDIGDIISSAGSEPVHLMGESMGGTLALAFALEFPQRVRTLTVSNGSYLGSSIQKVHEWKKLIDREGVAGWSKTMMADRFKPGQLSEVKWAWYHGEQSAQPKNSIIGALSVLLSTDMGPQLSDLEMPVLLMHGDSSPFVPPSVMATMKERIPHAELKIFPDTLHGLPFVRATECAQTLRDFLQRHPGNT